MGLFTSSYEAVRDQKQAERNTAIEKAEGVLSTIPTSPNADEILKAPAEVIAAKIRAKDWSSTEVVATFSRRCIETHNDTNCLTEGPSLPPTFRHFPHFRHSFLSVVLFVWY